MQVLGCRRGRCVCMCEIEGLEFVYTGWVSEVQVLLIISSVEGGGFGAIAGCGYDVGV